MMSDAPERHPQYAQAKAAAIRLLANRARTRADLERRLRGKELAPEAIEAALDDLARAGYVDDEQYARDRIDELLRKSKRGAQALTQALIGDGLPSELAKRVVAETVAGEDMRDWAVEVARERARGLQGTERQAARRRLYGYLKRRGFGDQETFRAMDDALSAVDEDH